MRGIAVILLFLLSIAGARAESFQALLDAARLGDLESVKTLLDAGQNPNRPFGDGYAPLMFAAGNGQVEMTRLLLAHGADTAYRDHNGDRALHWAAQRGHAATVSLLLAAGEPADSPDDRFGVAPLAQAARYGHAEIVRLLLAAGAAVDKADHTDTTALANAVLSQDVATVALLLDAGADVGVVGEYLLETPLHLAAQRGEREILGALIEKGAELERRDHTGRTALFWAAALGQDGNVATLLGASADPNARNHEGLTPFAAAVNDERHGEPGFRAVAARLVEVVNDLDGSLATAVWAGEADLVERLATRGAKAGGRDPWRRSALAGAVVHAGTAMLDRLLGLGATAGRDGAEALHAAAQRGRDDLIEKLLGLSVGVDARDAVGRTPLFEAAAAGQVGTVALLLGHGADRVPRDAAGLTLEDAMLASQAALLMVIDQREASRAWLPTDDLRAELGALEANHAAIRLLLKR